MKKLATKVTLFFCLAFGLAGIVNAGIYNPQTNRCHDSQGKFVAGPNCDPFACGCLFHEIEDFIIKLFR